MHAFWGFLGQFVFLNICLVMVEEAYVDLKAEERFNYLDSTQDPEDEEEQNEIKKSSQTMPEALRKLIQAEVVTDRAAAGGPNGLKSMTDLLQLEQTIDQFRKDNSKRTLSLILKIEEINWKGQHDSQQRVLSNKLTDMIGLKLKVYANIEFFAMNRYKNIRQVVFPEGYTPKQIKEKDIIITKKQKEWFNHR